MRVWLEILREKHPGVSWVQVERESERASVAGSMTLAAELAAVKSEDLAIAA